MDGRTRIDEHFITIDEDGYNDGPGIGYVTVNNVRRATLTIPQGKNTIDITKYLSDGSNNIKI